MAYVPKHVLITQFSLGIYSGSEIATLELASYLSARDIKVTVLTYELSSHIKDHFDELPQVSVYTTDEPNLEEILLGDKPDLAWIKHNLIPEVVLRGWDGLVVFNHLSSFHPLETPLFPEVEKTLADKVLFVSEEARDDQIASGLFTDFDMEKLQVLPNSAPDGFWVQLPKKRENLRKLLVVSNHLAPEVIEVVNLLRENIDVELVGVQHQHGARQQQVTPELLRTADAVMTIGKTVQYSIASGVPVYCYDIHGGPGWLAPENFKKAQYHNFAGRGFEKKSAKQIADEVQQGFPAATNEAIELNTRYAKSMTIDSLMAEVWESLPDSPSRKRSLKETESIPVTNFSTLFPPFVRSMARLNNLQPVHEDLRVSYAETTSLLEAKKVEVGEVRQANQTLRNKLRQARTKLKKARAELEQIKSSTSWRVTKPLRKIKGGRKSKQG